MRSLHTFLGIRLLGMMLLASSSVVAQPATHDSGGDGSTEGRVGQEYERLLALYKDWTFEQLQQHLGLEQDEVARLSFDPGEAANYAEICRGLKMTEDEKALFTSHGLVVVDPKQRHSFGSVYYHIYASDLPVLVTTDSVLHAWHRSYDAMLDEFECMILAPALADLLKSCHEQLAREVREPDIGLMNANYRDIDLYLTVARNLLAGAGGETWSGNLTVPAVFKMDEEALERLADIKSLKLQVPYPRTPSTRIYGGERFVDYSQFRPRGHYARFGEPQHYFRCLMWLSRPDCGFNVLPVDPVAGLGSDWQRELRDAALLSQLVRDSGNTQRFESISSIFQVLVGESDNLTVSDMLALFASERIETARQLADGSAATMEPFAEAIRVSGKARQEIRSQSIVSDPNDTYKVPPPSTFQMFGQGFTVDSYLLSHTVFDSIIFKEHKQRRMMPSSLDVSAVLGNDYATTLLEPELRRWNYCANLLAGRDFVAQREPEFWNGNIHHRWLNALRTLDEQPTGACVPQVMRSSAWRAKQLQTQLASWSELRRDNVLYAKQSYTRVPGCHYPDGFVEPYPELYGKLSQMAIATATQVEKLTAQSDRPQMQQQQQRIQDRQIHFLHRFAATMDQLARIAQQELTAQPMTDEQHQFIETTIDRRGSLPHGSGARPRYDGWYCELLYNVNDPSQWDPTIIDVHTNPTDHSVLQVGVGDVNFLVVAVDNQDDVAAYVGPVYSFYELTQPAEERLDDQRWQQIIAEDSLPPRADWTESFISLPATRVYDGRSLESRAGEWVVTESINGTLTKTLRVKSDDDGLQELLKEFTARGFPGRFGISLGGISPAGLQALVDVKQLTWVDITGSGIPAASIEDFRRQRPDVEVLPGTFGVETVVVCQRIDGLRRFKADAWHKLQPGRPLLLYVEPANLTWTRRAFSFWAKLELKATLTDASGAVVATEIPAPFEFQGTLPDDPVYAQLQIAIPDSLGPGDYKLTVDLKDGMSPSGSTATANLQLEY